MSQRVRVIVQARMGSSRLPGKVMAALSREPLLAHLIRRMHAARRWVNGDWQVHVATTTLTADDKVARWCKDNGVPCFRGEASDVLARYVQASEDLADEDVIVRATADNPVYCPVRTASLAAHHRQGEADYTGVAELSAIVPEAMQVGSLRRLAAATSDPYDREHVTPGFRRPELGFKATILPADWHGLRPQIRLTVDTPADLERMQRVFVACAAQDPLAPLERIYSYCRRDEYRQYEATFANQRRSA